MFTLQTLDKVGRLLDLCIKFFQEFVTWKISQNGRKPEPVESALLWAAELKTHGAIQGFTGTIHKIHIEIRVQDPCKSNECK